MNIAPNALSVLRLPKASAGKSFTALGGRRGTPLHRPLRTLAPETGRIGRMPTDFLRGDANFGCGAEPLADSTGCPFKWVRF